MPAGNRFWDRNPVSRKKPLPKDALCQRETAAGVPCKTTLGLARHGRKILCGSHVAQAKRAVAKRRQEKAHINPIRVTDERPVLSCADPRNDGKPCQNTHSLKNVGGVILCHIHRKKRMDQARGVKRQSPLRHESRCTICKSGRRVEIEAGFVDGVLSAKQLAQHLGTSEWAIYRHMKYFGLDERRALNALPYLGHIMREGSLQEPTARDAVAAALAAHKITHGMRAQLDERMEVLEKKTAEALVAVLDRLDLEPIVYKRAGELLQQEVNRRFFGDVTGEDLDTWDLDGKETKH